MGDISVDLFLETLKQLLKTSNLDFTTEEKYQLQSLEEEIKDLRGFLKFAEKKRHKHPEVTHLVVQIRDVVFEAENAVELFIVLVSKEDHASNSLREHMDHLFLDLERVRKDIKDLGAEVKQIYNENMYDISEAVVTSHRDSSTGSEGGPSSSGERNTSKVVGEKMVVGFEAEERKLIGKLLDINEDNGLEIISIIGPGGAGKTTLAREVYNHSLTLFKFKVRAWVNVSQDYNKRDMLISILQSLFPKNHEDYNNSIEDMLGEKVYKLLMGKRYLIVMDDIWAIEAWNDIQRTFPKEYTGSKVLFTCRLPIHPDSFRCIDHNLTPLTESCSWELLVKKVFGMKPCPPELVEVSKKIAQKCDGLPLAIVAIAGILATQDMTLNVWEEISKKVSSIIAEKQEGCMEILELSYNHLPLHLKACFLYIGAHPKDYEISVRELIWLWIAEGFIQQDEGGKSLEGVAKDCLLQLIERNLVMEARRSSIGKIKTCRIHDLFRELCFQKAKKNNFFAQVNGDDSSIPSTINKHRRLFIFRQFFDKFFFSSPYPQNLRSFLCLGSRHSRIELYMSFFVETFKLLRVFSFIADECRGEILRGQLVHLRYLAVQLSQKVDFPLPFHLFNLETLTVQASCLKDIKLSSHIFKMVKLRHLHTKQGIFTYHGYDDEDEGNMLDSLQTLHRMCICEHCVRFLERTPKLKKLGLIGDPDRKEDDVLVLPSLEFLKFLEMLSIYGSFESERVISTGLKLPSTLKQLTLKETHLDWQQLSTILLTLPNLEFLKLLDHSCVGPVWETLELEYGFSRLKYLRLCNLSIKEWISSDDQFPRLEVLVIQHCLHLKSIPMEFAYLFELREIRIENSSLNAEESTKEILEQREINMEMMPVDLNILARDNANWTDDDSSN